MQFKNHGNKGLAHLWGQVARGEDLPNGLYSADSNENFTLYVSNGMVSLYSYGAAIRRRVSTSTGEYEVWKNDASYSVTTSRHQSLARAAEFGADGHNAYDFTALDDVYSLNGRTRISMFVTEVQSKASDIIRGFSVFANTPRRQAKTIKREADKLLADMENLKRIVERGVTLESERGVIDKIDEYCTALNGCVQFGGDKVLFNAVYSLAE
jgi:hypothetical protein